MITRDGYPMTVLGMIRRKRSLLLPVCMRMRLFHGKGIMIMNLSLRLRITMVFLWENTIPSDRTGRNTPSPVSCPASIPLAILTLTCPMARDMR